MPATALPTLTDNQEHVSGMRGWIKNNTEDTGAGPSFFFWCVSTEKEEFSG